MTEGHQLQVRLLNIFPVADFRAYYTRNSTIYSRALLVFLSGATFCSRKGGGPNAEHGTLHSLCRQAPNLRPLPPTPFPGLRQHAFYGASNHNAMKIVDWFNIKTK